MDFTLTSDQQAYVEAAAAFADEALKPHAARWDKEHEFRSRPSSRRPGSVFVASIPRSSLADWGCRASMRASSSSVSPWAVPRPRRI